MLNLNLVTLTLSFLGKLNICVNGGYQKLWFIHLQESYWEKQDSDVEISRRANPFSIVTLLLSSLSSIYVYNITPYMCVYTIYTLTRH